MHSTFLLLVCLPCSLYGNRIQSHKEILSQSREASLKVPCELDGSKKTFAMTLLSSRPAIGQNFRSRPAAKGLPITRSRSVSMLPSDTTVIERPEVAEIEKMRQLFEMQLANSGGGGNGGGGRERGGGGGGSGNGEEQRLKFFNAARHEVVLDRWMRRTRSAIASQEELGNAELAALHKHQLQALSVLKEYQPSVLAHDKLQLIVALCTSNDDVLAVAGVEVTKESMKTLAEQGVFAMMRQQYESKAEEIFRVMHVLAAPSQIDKGKGTTIKKDMIEELARYSTQHELQLDVSSAEENGDLQ